MPRPKPDALMESHKIPCDYPAAPPRRSTATRSGASIAGPGGGMTEITDQPKEPTEEECEQMLDALQELATPPEEPKE